MKLSIENNSILCEHLGKLLWTLDIDKLKVIGEFITSAGPWNDDWFLVFANKLDAGWEVPIEASTKQFWAQLSHKMKQELIPSLAASVTNASRIIYPKELAGEELFRVTAVSKNLKANQQRTIEWNEANIEFTNQVKRLFL
jgi:hypothetical protein